MVFQHSGGEGEILTIPDTPTTQGLSAMVFQHSAGGGEILTSASQTLPLGTSTTQGTGVIPMVPVFQHSAFGRCGSSHVAISSRCGGAAGGSRDAKPFVPLILVTITNVSNQHKRLSAGPVSYRSPNSPNTGSDVERPKHDARARAVCPMKSGR